MKWSGNAQSCYVVWGYVYLKVKSCKKMANDNICYSRSRSWPSHMLHSHWVSDVNLSVNVWIQTCYKVETFISDMSWQVMTMQRSKQRSEVGLFSINKGFLPTENFKVNKNVRQFCQWNSKQLFLNNISLCYKMKGT